MQLLLEKESQKDFNSEDFDYFLWELLESKDIDWSGIIPPERGKYEFICSQFKSPVSVAILLTSLTWLPLMKEAQQTIILDHEIINAFKVQNDGVIHYLDSLEITTQAYEKIMNPQRNSVIVANYQSIIELSKRVAQNYRNGIELPESVEAYYAQIKATSFVGILPMMDPEVISYLGSFRNQQWLPILREQINKGDAFIAVGLMHLVGKDGIINLLRQDGYKVTPLKQ